MKKLLGILFLSLLLSSNVYANTDKGCNKDLKFSWEIGGWNSSYRYKGQSIPGAIVFYFDNPSKNRIMITYVAILTEDKTVIKELKNQDLTLEPFTGTFFIPMERGSLMTELIKYGRYSCKYVTASIKKKNTNNMNVAAPRTDKFRTWHIFAAIGVFFILAILYDVVTNKNSSPQNNKIKKKENKMKNNVVKILATLGLILAIALILKGVFDIGLTLF
jgi:hypothetical protein